MPSAPVFTKYPAHVVARRSALVLSGWWRRVFAATVDSVVVVAIMFGVLLLGIGNENAAPVLVLVAFVAVGLYYVIGHGSRSGQTLGKRMLGIAVRRKGGARVGYLRATVRLLAYWMFGFVPLIGIIDGLRPLWNDMNRSYHDGIANTIVVRVR